VAEVEFTNGKWPGVRLGSADRSPALMTLTRRGLPWAKLLSIGVAITSPITDQSMLDLGCKVFASGERVSRVRGPVMRIVLAAAIFAVSFALAGCFHFHQSQVYTAPQSLPPLK
jgi:hypothetical protein